MAKIISVALQKGGVGKSTTVQCLANGLGQMGKKVLVLDIEPQCDTSYSSGIDDIPKTIIDVLSVDCSIKAAVVQTKYYDLVCGDEYLTNVERSEELDMSLLKSALQPIRNEYDYILIDTPPALGNILTLSLVASDYVIIPCEPSTYALKGLSALNSTICGVKSTLNSNLKVLGIVLVKYHDRAILNRDIRDMIDEYSEQLDTKLFDTFIREGVAVREAQTTRVPLLDYAPRSNPNIDYLNLCKEVIERAK